MPDSLFGTPDTDVLYFSRSDAEEIFGAWSKHGFVLEDREWPSVEHYYQAMKFEDRAYQDKIRQAAHPREARKLGRRRFRKIRRDWKKVKSLYMTRALYTKCRAHPDIAKALLETGNKKLVENSVYDYYWGCGRDRRGTNMYGQVLMNVRAKLNSEKNTDQGPEKN
ncbi:MAG: NADAR family protein [Ketobacteraceae bacterium]|nr:NADAR family protein [Ketobacteraceae bacterium]